MDTSANVALLPDAPEWPTSNNWATPELSRRSSTSPASPFVPAPLPAPLHSPPLLNQNDSPVYLNLPLPNDCMQNYSIPPSAMLLPEAGPRRPELSRSVTDQPKKRIPRPPNAFMLFRSWMLKNGKVPTDVEKRQQNLSRIAGRCWNMLNDDEKKVWRDQAANVLEAHQRKFPSYKFTPAPKGTGKAGKLKRGEEFGEEVVDDATRIQRLAEMCYPELKGRDVAPSKKRPAPKAKRQEYMEDIGFRSMLSRSFSPVSPLSSSSSSPGSYSYSPVSSLSPSPSGSSAPSPVSSMSMPSFLPEAQTFHYPPYLYSNSGYSYAPYLSATTPSPSGEYDLSYVPFDNDPTPTALNFQMTYAPATTYPPPAGSYTFEAPSLQPLGPYPGLSSFGGHHDLQLPYANLNMYPGAYQQLSAAPLTSSEEQAFAQAEFVRSLSFEPMGHISGHLEGSSPGSVQLSEDQGMPMLKLEPPADSRIATPASQ